MVASITWGSFLVYNNDVGLGLVYVAASINWGPLFVCNYGASLKLV